MSRGWVGNLMGYKRPYSLARNYYRAARPKLILRYFYVLESAGRSLYSTGGGGLEMVVQYYCSYYYNLTVTGTKMKSMLNFDGQIEKKIL